MRIEFVVVVACLIMGCASQPEAPPAAATAAPAAAPAAAKDGNPVATVQEARKLGYKVVNEEGRTLYCREQLMTGSHMRKEIICLTEQELADARAASKRSMEQMQKAIPPPQGTRGN